MWSKAVPEGVTTSLDQVGQEAGGRWARRQVGQEAGGPGGRRARRQEGQEAGGRRQQLEDLLTPLLQLAGLVLVDDSKEPAVIRRFTEAGLPEGIQERLAVLFAARWEIGITLVSSSSETASLKYLRASVDSKPESICSGSGGLWPTSHPS